jgi:hypothetical protein
MLRWMTSTLRFSFIRYGELHITHKPRLMRRRRGAVPGLGSEYTQQQCHDEHDHENVEQDLGDFGSACGDAGKAEYRGNDRDDEKYDCVVKHGGSPFLR